mgnify:CR=1 FL=1
MRRLVEAGTRIVQMGFAGTGEVDDVVDRAQQEIYDVTERRNSEDYKPLSDLMEGVLAEIESFSTRREGLTGVPTGFDDLDRLQTLEREGLAIVKEWVVTIPTEARLAMRSVASVFDAWLSSGQGRHAAAV